MRQKEILIDPDAIDADGIAEAQAVAAAGNLSLNGALIVGGIFTGDYARQIGITSDGADNGRTFTITGTDADGKAQTEAVTGPNATTVESTKYFKAITSIAVDDACAGNISVGTVDEFVTNTIPIETHNSDAATVSIERLSGTIDLSIEESFSRIQYTDTISWNAGPPALTAITSYGNGEMSNHASAIRAKINSYSTGAEFRIIINQNRDR